MRKIILLSVMLIAFSSCKEKDEDIIIESELVGRWYGSSVSKDGLSYTDITEKGYYLALYADGTYFKNGDLTPAGVGPYTVTDKKVDLIYQEKHVIYEFSEFEEKKALVKRYNRSDTNNVTYFRVYRNY